MRNGWWHRIGTAAAAAVLACVTVVTSVAANPALPGGFAGGADPFGFGFHGGLQTVSVDSSAGLIHSQFDLTRVDLHSGHLMGDHAAFPLTTQYAAQLDMLASNQLAVDQARLAAEAKRRADEKKRQMAASGIAVKRGGDPGNPQPWELDNFSAGCHPDNAKWQARIELVLAFEQMCAAAKRDGVTLRLNSAYRSPARQKQLFDAAVAKYGSTSAARRWVAYSDGTNCSSRHCSGTAVDIDMSYGAREWLHRQVGCFSSATGAQVGPASCASGQAKLKQGNLYGLVAPLSHEDWHWELGLPVPGSERVGANCDPGDGYSVQQMIASIFRCRLAEAGYSGAEIDRVVAEALVVAKCESGFNPDVTVFAGRYVDKPHPQTGLRYSASGVYQFIRSSADSWIEGGYANVNDPAANIDGAARYYIHTRKNGGRGWEPWECVATGHFAAKSVLPGWPGGPDKLPDWAWQY